MRAPVRAYIGLGSNLADPLNQLAAARAQLERLPRTRLVTSSVDFQSLPWGDPDQPDYINAVVALDTELTPLELLAELLEIEKRQGRDRSSARRNGPRTLDLDLLLYGNACIDLPQLQVPHPRLSERAFVLLPLAQIAPDLAIPGLGPISALMHTDFARLCWPLVSTTPPPKPSQVL